MPRQRTFHCTTMPETDTIDILVCPSGEMTVRVRSNNPDCGFDALSITLSSDNRKEIRKLLKKG